MPQFKTVGVLSLHDTLGGINFADYLESIRHDLFSLQEGGIDAILIENQGDKATSRSALPETTRLMRNVIRTIKSEIKVHYLVGVLPADYESASEIADRFGAYGIWMDTLVDTVSPKYTEKEMKIKLEPQDVQRCIDYRMLFAEVQPRNFYKILSRKSIDQSIEQAKDYADAICIVGQDNPPSVDLVKKARKIVGRNYFVGVAGKLSPDNVSLYVKIADFGVFFSSLRRDGDYEKPVEIEKVRGLVRVVKGV